MNTLPITLIILAFVGLQDAQTITVDTSQAPDLANFASTVKQTLQVWYPKISTILSSPNYSPPSQISITFQTNCNGVGYTTGNQIVGCVNYYRQNPNDVASMVVSATFLIQQYKNCPDWLTQGIADWIRRYNYEATNKPSPPSSTNYYTDGNGVTSYFLQYILDVTTFSPNMIYWANKDCREGNYADSLWPRLTGKTLDQHWQTMLNRGTGPLTITTDTSQAPALQNFANTVKSVLTNYYPTIANQLLPSPNYNAPKNITVFFDLSYTGIAYTSYALNTAYTSGPRIVGRVQYYIDHQNDDIGSLVHELAHAIQLYNTGTVCPSWIVEGIADWVRYYNYEPSRKPGKPGASNKYTDGYGVSAYFFDYINRITNYSPNMVYWVNKDCREGNYADTIFPRLTGKTLDQLWADMMKSG